LLRTAIREYTLATELDPSDWEFENSLANAYAELGDLDSARGHHFEASQDSTESAFLYVDWAKTHLRQARRLTADRHKSQRAHYLQEASARLDDAERRDSGSMYLAEARAQLAALQGHTKEATAQYQRAIAAESERCSYSINARSWAEALRVVTTAPESPRS
jgi:tetratricopeptide (TPR) repeat protein